MRSSGTFAAYRLAEEHELLRAAVRELAAEKIAPRAAEVDAAGEFPWDVYEVLRKADLHAVHIPEEYGGAGADAVAGAIVIEEVARACASSSLIPLATKLGTTPLLLAGSAELERQVLPPVAAGDAMFSYALSERDAGSDVAAMRTRAVRDGDTWVLNGTKCWVSNAGVSTYYTVMAVTDPAAGADGISAFVVHEDDPGFAVGTKERKLGTRGSPTCEIHLTDCTVPADRIIGEPGSGLDTALRSLDHTRLAVGAQAVGIAQGALDAALGYVRERRQFGQRIADFQGVQVMVADMAMKTEAARWLVYAAAVAAEKSLVWNVISRWRQAIRAACSRTASRSSVPSTAEESFRAAGARARRRFVCRQCTGSPRRR